MAKARSKPSKQAKKAKPAKRAKPVKPAIKAAPKSTPAAKPAPVVKAAAKSSLPLLRVGIIGAGGIAAKMHLPQLTKIPGVEVTMLAGRKPERLQRLANLYGGEIVTDYNRVIDDPRLDAVVVATPHPQHVEWGIKALHAGKHLFMQKPLAPTIEEANRFVQVVEASPKITYCLPQLSFPALENIKQLMASGALGRISAVHCRVSHGGPEVYYAEVRDLLGEPPLKPGEKLWFFQAGEASVGALFDMGVYAVARLVAVLGTARRVTGFTTILDKPSEVEDTATLLVEFKNGALGTAETGWTDGARTARISVHGTIGRVEQNGYFDPKLVMHTQASKTREDIPPKRTEILCKGAYKNPHEQWIDAIRTNTKPTVETARAARHITEIMLAGLESAKSGQAVDLISTLE